MDGRLCAPALHGGKTSHLNQTTQHPYTSSLAGVPVAVRPERSAAKSKARKPARSALFDFAADAATLRANGGGFAQQVQLCANLLWFDLDHRMALREESCQMGAFLFTSPLALH